MVNIDFEALSAASGTAKDASATIGTIDPTTLFQGGKTGFGSIETDVIRAWNVWRTGRDAIKTNLTGIGDTFQAIIDAYQSLDCRIADNVGGDVGDPGSACGPTYGGVRQVEKEGNDLGCIDGNPIERGVVGPICGAPTHVYGVEWDNFLAAVRINGQDGRPYWQTDYTTLLVGDPLLRKGEIVLGDPPVLALLTLFKLDLCKEEQYIDYLDVPGLNNDIAYIPMQHVPGEVQQWLDGIIPGVTQNPRILGITTDFHGHVYLVDREAKLVPLIHSEPVPMTDLSPEGISLLHSGVDKLRPIHGDGPTTPDASVDGEGTLRVTRPGNAFWDWKGTSLESLPQEDQKVITEAAQSMGIEKVTHVGVNASGDLVITSGDGKVMDLSNRRPYTVEHDMPVDRPETAANFDQLRDVFGDETTIDYSEMEMRFADPDFDPKDAIDDAVIQDDKKIDYSVPFDKPEPADPIDPADRPGIVRGSNVSLDVASPDAEAARAELAKLSATPESPEITIDTDNAVSARDLLAGIDSGTNVPADAPLDTDVDDAIASLRDASDIPLPEGHTSPDTTATTADARELLMGVGA